MGFLCPSLTSLIPTGPSLSPSRCHGIELLHPGWGELSSGTPLPPKGPLGEGLGTDRAHKVFPDVLQGWQESLMETDGIWLFLKPGFCEEQPAICGQGRQIQPQLLLCLLPTRGFILGWRIFRESRNERLGSVPPRRENTLGKLGALSGSIPWCVLGSAVGAFPRDPHGICCLETPLGCHYLKTRPKPIPNPIPAPGSRSQQDEKSC